MACADITINREREEAVDLTSPFMDLGEYKIILRYCVRTYLFCNCTFVYLMCMYIVHVDMSNRLFASVQVLGSLLEEWGGGAEVQFHEVKREK